MPNNKTFRDREKERYTKLEPKVFDPGIQLNGKYKNIPRSFCLENSNIGANLYRGIRIPAMEYFVRRGIPWHDGLIDRTAPSNHLCCSQSCCVNFLFPMAYNPGLIKSVFSSIDELNMNIDDVLPIKQDIIRKKERLPYIVFEWIGTLDYLNEQKRKGGNRTRGANYTSADFAFRFRQTDGKIHLVLGEWKYTEEYGVEDKGEDEVRLDNYREAFNKNEGVFFQEYRELYRAMFFDPFYQLLRLQLLAQEMEFKKEFDADVVSVLLICPEANKEFRNRVTSPELTEYADFKGKGPLEIWKMLVPPEKFNSISVENLFRSILNNQLLADAGWIEYLKVRYGWENE